MILAKYGFAFKKSLGQNFLIDPNILRIIAAHAELDPRTGVIEVGAGIGALTEELAKQAGRVLAFEIDRRLIPILEETLQPYANVKVIHQDVLKADLKSMVNSYLVGMEKIKVVANLPYYVTTPILVHLIESGLLLDGLVLMVQKEVAQRLLAKSGTKAYGSLTVFIQYYLKPQLIKVVPRHVFVPRPNVDSALIKLSPRTSPPVQVVNEAFFFKTVRASFAKRRKTLLNNLIQFAGEQNKERILDVLAQLGINPQIRGENLTIDQFAALANKLYHKLALSPEFMNPSLGEWND
jgi:16S rRNA (adenine1518-N6/adenine1519-N6)-dimethyltransferase